MKIIVRYGSKTNKKNSVTLTKTLIGLIFFFRDFIEEGVVDYANKNPGTVVYVSPQPCRVPKIVAEYCKCPQLCSNQT